MSTVERCDRLAQVESQLNYHRERLARHRRLHGDAPSPKHRQLEDAYHAAQLRLASATEAEGEARAQM